MKVIAILKVGRRHDQGNDRRKCIYCQYCYENVEYHMIIFLKCRMKLDVILPQNLVNLNVTKDIKKPFSGKKNKMSKAITAIIFCSQNDSTSWSDLKKIYNMHHNDTYMNAHHWFSIKKTTKISVSNNWWDKLYIPVMEYTSYYKRIYTGLKIFKIYFNWKMPVLTVENSIYSLLSNYEVDMCVVLCSYFSVLANFLQ